jgi:hypothetical protein
MTTAGRVVASDPPIATLRFASDTGRTFETDARATIDVPGVDRNASRSAPRGEHIKINPKRGMPSYTQKCIHWWRPFFMDDATPVVVVVVSVAVSTARSSGS